MKKNKSNKQRASLSDQSTKRFGERKQTAAFFSESVLNRHRHRFAAPKLLSLVYLLIPRLNSLKRAVNRPQSIQFKRILNQTHRHTGNILQKNTKNFNQQVCILRQIIYKISAGGEHSIDGNRSMTRSSIEIHSIRPGLKASSEISATKKIFLPARQFDIRRIFRTAVQHFKGSWAAFNRMNAASAAETVADPTLPPQQAGGHVLRIYQDTAVYRQVRTIQQVIQKAITGHEHSPDGRHLLNMISAETNSVRKSLNLIPEIRFTRNPLLSEPQSETRRTPAYLDYPAKSFFKNVNLLIATGNAGRYFNPDSPLQQSGRFVHRLFQNNLVPIGRIPIIKDPEDKRIISGHARTILDRAEKYMGSGSIQKSAAIVFLRGSPAIYSLQSRWTNYLSKQKSESVKSGTINLRPTPGPFIPKPYLRTPVPPAYGRTHTPRSLIQTGFEPKAKKHAPRIPWPAAAHQSQDKDKIYQVTKKRFSTQIRDGFTTSPFEDRGSSAVLNIAKARTNPSGETVRSGGSDTRARIKMDINRSLESHTGQASSQSSKIANTLLNMNSNRLVMRQRPGISGSIRSSADTQYPKKVNSDPATHPQNRLNLTLIKPDRYSIGNQNIQDRHRESPNIRMHKSTRMLTRFPATHLIIADSNRRMNPIVSTVINDYLRFPNSPMNQVVRRIGNDPSTTTGMLGARAFELSGTIRESSLHYRSNRFETHRITSNSKQADFYEKSNFAESGIGTDDTGRLPHELETRAGGPSSEQSNLSEHQKDAVREYLNSMYQPEVNRVADKVYDIIEKRLSIEQERRGWA